MINWIFGHLMTQSSWHTKLAVTVVNNVSCPCFTRKSKNSFEYLILKFTWQSKWTRILKTKPSGYRFISQYIKTCYTEYDYSHIFKYIYECVCMCVCAGEGRLLLSSSFHNYISLGFCGYGKLTLLMEEGYFALPKANHTGQWHPLAHPLFFRHSF